jgi:HD-GYP domain-containing protein (c-di-GMP phosphodiesterase class II)
MRTIATCLTDKTFLSKMFSYLEACHGVRALVVDKDGQIDPLDGQTICECPHKKFYPVSFEEDIGGIRCSAETREALEMADPHIHLCMDCLQRLIEKAQVMQQTMDEMLRLSDQFYFLFGLSTKLAGVQDQQHYCALVLQEIAHAIGADAAFAHTEGQKDRQRLIPHGLSVQDLESICKEPALQSLPAGKTAIVSLQDKTSALATPIKEKGGQIGHMVFLKRPEKHPFTAYEKQFVSIINNIISPTMESLGLYHSLHVLYLNTVKALAAAIDAKDAYTHGHSSRVAKYSIAIGKQLDVSPPRLQDLEVAAYMHDLGKIGISEAILSKPGKLSKAEFEEIKKHPVLTNKILEPIELPDFIVDATMQHHERLDGLGYPLGLKGDSITFFARIIAVADVFDALTSARPYREAMTVEDALTTIYDGIGCQFDREVVRAFIAALRRSTDQDLAGVYSKLKFMRPDALNQFIEKLSRHVTDLPGRTSGLENSDASLSALPT